MKINPLLCSPSPRDIAEVYDSIIGCPYDILWAKYYTEQAAYETLRDFFINHPEYTHLVICPDDLIITKDAVEFLIKDLEECDYPILSGVCNVDLAGNSNKLSITENLPHPARFMKNDDGKIIRWGYRWYQWYETPRTPPKIFRVPHSGFACQFIRRDIVEKIQFLDDIKYNEGEGTGVSSGVDVMFSIACEWADVPIFVDARVKLVHLRKPGPLLLTFGDPEVIWRSNGKFHKFKPKTSFQERETKSLKDWGATQIIPSTSL